MDVSFFVEPVPERDDEGRWFAKVRVLAWLPGKPLVDRVVRYSDVSPDSEPWFRTEEDASDFARNLAERWLRAELSAEGS
jgi:hypothetical protein